MDVERLTAMVEEAAADSPLTGLGATVWVRVPTVTRSQVPVRSPGK